MERDGVLLAEPMRMKGIHVTAETDTIINPESMRTLTTHPQRNLQLSVTEYHIRKRFKTQHLYNTTNEKRITFQSNKRWLLPDPNPTLDTRPYGYSHVPRTD